MLTRNYEELEARSDQESEECDMHDDRQLIWVDGDEVEEEGIDLQRHHQLPFLWQSWSHQWGILLTIYSSAKMAPHLTTNITISPTSKKEIDILFHIPRTNQRPFSAASLRTCRLTPKLGPKKSTYWLVKQQESLGRPSIKQQYILSRSLTQNILSIYPTFKRHLETLPLQPF